MKLVAVLTLVLLIAGIIERALHERNVRRVGIRVLVNGTRGKTSVTRLLAAALNEAGYKVFAKCTGTAASVILPDGTEQPLIRRRGARLTEQLPFFRRAARAGVDAVVVECMAVRPESQRVMAELTRPTLVLVTNARVDHVAEIGASEEETLGALAFSIPEDAVVISAEAELTRYGFAPVGPEREPLGPDYLDRFGYPVFEDNIHLVMAACAHLGIGRETALRGMLKARPDAGMAGPFKIGGCTVINAFAANDMRSSAALFEHTERELGLSGQPIRVVFNNRADREYRLRTFLPLIRALSARITYLVAIGDHACKAARYYQKRSGVICRVDRSEQVLEEPGVVLCLGSIKGAGLKFIERCAAHKEA